MWFRVLRVAEDTELLSPKAVGDQVKVDYTFGLVAFCKGFSESLKPWSFPDRCF